MAIPIIKGLTMRALKNLKKFKSGKDTTVEDFVKGKNLKDFDKMSPGQYKKMKEKELQDYIEKKLMTERMGKGNKK
jgi:hypothetical protein